MTRFVVNPVWGEEHIKGQLLTLKIFDDIMFINHERSLRLNINLNSVLFSNGNTKKVISLIGLVWRKDLPMNLAGNSVGALANGKHSRMQNQATTANNTSDTNSRRPAHQMHANTI